MRSLFYGIAMIVMASACMVAQATQQKYIDVQLSTAQIVVYGDADLTVNMSIMNTSDQPVSLFKWQLPSNPLEGSLFRITHHDGTVVNYRGLLVSRIEPSEEDQITLQPGKTLSFQVELRSEYDLSKDGRYNIEYVGHQYGRNSNASIVVNSVPLSVWLSGVHSKQTKNSVPRLARRAAISQQQNQESNITFSGACTGSQQETIKDVVKTSRTLVDESVRYLKDDVKTYYRVAATVPMDPNKRNQMHWYSAFREETVPDDRADVTQRWTLWFGKATTPRVDLVRKNYKNIQEKLNSSGLKFDCSCKDRGKTIAYVRANTPSSSIYLCNIFWSLPHLEKLENSQTGTVIHEVAHLAASAGDFGYGIEAIYLAKKDPNQALRNADNYKFFSTAASDKDAMDLVMALTGND